MPDEHPDLDQFLRGIGAGKPQTEEERESRTEGGGYFSGGSFTQGLAQSGLGLLEATPEFIEKGIQPDIPSFRFPIPESWRRAAESYKREAESTPQGVAGEIAGTVGIGLLPFLGEGYEAARAPELLGLLNRARGAEDLGTFSRGAGFTAGPQVGRAAQAANAARRAMDPGMQAARNLLDNPLGLPVRSGVISAASQPVFADDQKEFAKQKAEQFGWGFGLGLGGRAAGLAREAPKVEPVFSAGRGIQPKLTREASEKLREAMREATKEDIKDPNSELNRRLGEILLRGGAFAAGGPHWLGHLAAQLATHIARRLWHGGSDPLRRGAQAIRNRGGVVPWGTGLLGGQLPLTSTPEQEGDDEESQGSAAGAQP